MQEVDGSIPFSSTTPSSQARGAALPSGGCRDRVGWDPGEARRPADLTDAEEALMLVVLLILLAAASRLLPHPPNFAPVAAIGLFAGAMLDRRAAWLVPLVALLLSDLIIGFYHPVGMLWNYVAFAACLMIGSGLLARGRSLPRLAGATLSSAVVFFALSNFGMWASGYYPRTWAGLVECYVAALPFFRNTLVSDVVFVAALFGGHAWLSRLLSRPAHGTASA